MKDTHKRVRDKLIEFDTEKYNRIIEKAKLTPRQKTIITEAICDDMFIWEIAVSIGFSESTVKKELQRIYERLVNIVL